MFKKKMILIWENKLPATETTRMKTCNMLHVGQWYNHVYPCYEKQEKPLFGTNIRVTQKKPEPKQDKAYNIATGNASSDEPAPVVQRKRRRGREPKPRPDQRDEVKENDGPMSHQEYIEKRRKEADFSQPYQELTADMLESSSSALNLVGYENSTEEADRIKTRTEQRYPAPGDPVCVVCGKYGEYICNEKPQSGQLLVEPFSARRCTLEVPEAGGDTWDYDRNRWSKKRSGLCTYECWKCQKPGHLAEDCLVSTSHCESGPAGEAYNRVLFHDVNGNFAISPFKLHNYKHVSSLQMPRNWKEIPGCKMQLMSWVNHFSHMFKL
ncbi:UNVERIFIED_CONTAM: hypothetical protein Slati_4492100 [Sesamum latifolium]|uniref:CCHC-type domain-containing protein n=1 Tax=Sesamum latifolium TaxID=2727402 RepID=A0AAW2SS18_9LAMI